MLCTVCISHQQIDLIAQNNLIAHSIQQHEHQNNKTSTHTRLPIKHTYYTTRSPQSTEEINLWAFQNQTSLLYISLYRWTSTNNLYGKTRHSPRSNFLLCYWQRIGYPHARTFTRKQSSNCRCALFVSLLMKLQATFASYARLWSASGIQSTDILEACTLMTCTWLLYQTICRRHISKPSICFAYGVLPPSYKPWFPCPTFDRPSYIKKLWKKLKRQVTYKILIVFYHLTTMKIQIIKKFYIRWTIKVGHGNLGFAFFWDGGSTYYL